MLPIEGAATVSRGQEWRHSEHCPVLRVDCIASGPQNPAHGQPGVDVGGCGVWPSCRTLYKQYQTTG